MNKLLVNTIISIAILCVGVAIATWIAESSDLSGLIMICVFVPIFLLFPVIVIADELYTNKNTEEKNQRLRNLRTQFINAQMIMIIIAIAAGFVTDYKSTLLITSVAATIIGLVIGAKKIFSLIDAREDNKNEQCE